MTSSGRAQLRNDCGETPNSLARWGTGRRLLRRPPCGSPRNTAGSSASTDILPDRQTQSSGVHRSGGSPAARLPHSGARSRQRSAVHARGGAGSDALWTTTASGSWAPYGGPQKRPLLAADQASAITDEGRRLRLPGSTMTGEPSRTHGVTRGAPPVKRVVGWISNSDSWSPSGGRRRVRGDQTPRRWCDDEVLDAVRGDLRFVCGSRFVVGFA